MPIEISRASYYQKSLRKADAHEGPNGYDGLIDTDDEARTALKDILSGLDIASAPAAYQVILRRDVDSNDTPTGYNGKVDPEEADKAIAVLIKIAPLRSVLADFVLPPQPKCEYKPIPPMNIPKVKKVQVNSAPGRYTQSMEELYKYLTNNSGDKPNASKAYTIDDKKAMMIYHVYEDNPTHIRNGGGTTSEAAALGLDFGALYAGIENDPTLLDGIHNYLRYFMMPHDGLSSPQLPDDKLCNSTYAPPGLSQWLIDLSGHAKRGDAIFGENVCYNIYDPGFPPLPSEAWDKEAGIPDLHSYWPKDNNTYKFGAALDAEQWFVDGYYFASAYTNEDLSKDIARSKYSLLDTLSHSEKYGGVERFGRYWGANLNEGWGWKADGNDLYTGYQDPAAWVIMGEPKVASNMVNFLSDAQKQYQQKFNVTGPFMPVYNSKGEWGFEGADPNTEWTGFQYRAFAHLAHYYFLTGDPKAKAMLGKFVSWSEKNKIEEGGKISLPADISKETGKVKVVRYSPNNHGLYAQGLIFMAAKDNDDNCKKLAEGLLDDLTKNRKNALGAYPEPGEPLAKIPDLTYGFHQAEVGIALGLYHILLEKQK